jgi:NAD(P)-dependent dehydrogenase (short-subunit alcohol dehydrogenase family)
MKIAIVTGVLGGIGKESALQLCRNGYAVVGMDVIDTTELSDFNGYDFTYIKGDLSCAESRQALVDAAVQKGDVAVLVNVAGVAPKVRRDILEMTEESYDFVMGINTKGTLFLTQIVANQMVKQKNGGSIVNISSCSAYTSSTSRGEYCISKAGVSMITKLFADRLANEGITVNEICPGIIATGMTAAVKEKYDSLIAGGLVPLGRWGQPADIAKAVVALCDGTFGYTTGQSFILDGGMHIRKL